MKRMDFSKKNIVYISFAAVVALISFRLSYQSQNVSPAKMINTNQIGSRQAVERFDKGSQVQSIPVKVDLAKTFENRREEKRASGSLSIDQRSRDNILDLLDENKNGYRWSENIFGISREKYSSNLGTVIASVDKDLLVVHADVATIDMRPLVYSSKLKKYGVFSGQVVLLAKSEELTRYLAKKKIAFNEVGGSLFIEQPQLSLALQEMNELKNILKRDEADIAVQYLSFKPK